MMTRPERYRNAIVPHIYVDGASHAIEFYERAFGADELFRIARPGLHVLTDDNAALLRRAVNAGATEIEPPTDMFYGASSATLRDPFGHVWVLLTWKEDLEPAEMERRGNAFLR